MSELVQKLLPDRNSNQTTKVPTNSRTNIIPSSQKVVAIDDLLKQLLIRLPVKSLLRFKSVSKHWYFIISQKDLFALRNPSTCAFSGLFLHRSSFNCVEWSPYAPKFNSPLEFLPLKHDESHFESITRVPNLSSIIILNSCNGLLLCLGYNELEQKGGCHVLNPTTKQFSTIQLLQNPEENNALIGICLAYDPLLSPHYKVIAVRVLLYILAAVYSNDIKTQIVIEIYSSETKTWRVCRTKFTIQGPGYIFDGGVYWNGAINWLNPWLSPIYFKIEEEHLGTMPALISPHGKRSFDALNMYFGTSHGHLYCSEIYSPMVIFNVYEMKKDYSEWIVKYNIDLTILAAYFPIMLHDRGNGKYCSYKVLCIDDKDGESFIVLLIPGKFISYNLVDNSYKIIQEYEGATLTSDTKYELQTNQYIESFSLV